jgi:sarcosine/dimethylglycine N-methyltransferase
VFLEKKKRDEATARVRAFYDGPADIIYKATWGENLHLGVPRTPPGSYEDAIQHATELMALHAPLDQEAHVLDLGSGYGGPAGYLASTYGCHVTGLNVSAVEIEEAERRMKAQGVADLVSFDCGDFHELPYADGSFDVVWSQDSLMYGADKRRILEEVHRVLKPGGTLDFTDILASRDLAAEDRDRLYARVRTPEMWDTERYLVEMIELGFMIGRVEDWSQHVAGTYAWARQQAMDKRGELESKVGADLVQRTLDGLTFWVDMAERGKVGWVLVVAHKP